MANDYRVIDEKTWERAMKKFIYSIQTITSIQGE